MGSNHKTEPHYVTEQRRLLGQVLAANPRARAFELAVGGNFTSNAVNERITLERAGLTNGMSLLDFGCGIGRVPYILYGAEPRIETSDYLGIDILPDMIKAARDISPPKCRFEVSTGFKLPAKDNSFDMACAFSVFTHLHPPEIFIYMQELHRILKPSGRLMFSFWQFGGRRDRDIWRQFMKTVDVVRDGYIWPPNTFIEEPVIGQFASEIGFHGCNYINHRPDDPNPFGQTVAILTKNVACAS